jgi:hypothetical protein
MRIEGPNATNAPASARGSGRAAASGFTLPTLGTATAAPVASAPAMAGIAGVGALLAAQYEDDITEKRRRARRRADDLLDQLDGLKLATLQGTVTRMDVARLAQSLRDVREQVDDPGLEEILDAVELRAEVELAKLEQLM